MREDFIKIGDNREKVIGEGVEKCSAKFLFVFKCLSESVFFILFGIFLLNNTVLC